MPMLSAGPRLRAAVVKRRSARKSRPPFWSGFRDHPPHRNPSTDACLTEPPRKRLLVLGNRFRKILRGGKAYCRSFPLLTLKREGGVEGRRARKVSRDPFQHDAILEDLYRQCATGPIKT